MLRAALLPSLVLVLPACAPTIWGMARYAEMGLDGDVLIADAGVSASNDFDALGLDDEESTPGFVGDFKWGSPHLTVSQQSSSFSGDGTLDATISIGGDTISAGADVASDLDLGLTNATLTFDILPTSMLELGVGFGVNLIDVDAKFVEDGTGETVETDEMLPAPVLAVRGGAALGPVEIQGLLSGISYDGGDESIEYFDLDLYGRYSFLGGNNRLSGSLVLGWRESSLDVEYEDDDSDVELDLGYSGPFVGLQLRF